MNRRSRQLLMVAFVATALAADRAVAAAPREHQQRPQATESAARRLAGRLVVTLRQTVRGVGVRPLRQEGVRMASQAVRFVAPDDEPPPELFQQNPFQYRLPPPLV